MADTSLTAHIAATDFRQFRSNAVLRWEYRPGSVLFLVWTQGRNIASADAGSFRFARDVRELMRAGPANSLALKLSYRLDR